LDFTGCSDVSLDRIFTLPVIVFLTGRRYPIFCFTCLLLPYTFSLGGHPLCRSFFLPIVQTHRRRLCCIWLILFRAFWSAFSAWVFGFVLPCLCGCLVAFSASSSFNVGRFSVCDSGSSVSFFSMIPICLLTLSLIFSSSCSTLDYSSFRFFVVDFGSSARGKILFLTLPKNQSTHTLHNNIATLTVIIPIAAALSSNYLGKTWES